MSKNQDKIYDYYIKMENINDKHNEMIIINNKILDEITHTKL